MRPQREGRCTTLILIIIIIMTKKRQAGFPVEQEVEDIAACTREEGDAI